MTTTKPNKPFLKNIVDTIERNDDGEVEAVASKVYTNHLGVPIVFRVVLNNGAGYGAWNLAGNPGWALNNTTDHVFVEFYDARYDFTPHGQFTGGRYRLETLQELPARLNDLVLDGGVRNWVAPAQAVNEAVFVAETLIQLRDMDLI